MKYLFNVGLFVLVFLFYCNSAPKKNVEKSTNSELVLEDQNRVSETQTSIGESLNDDKTQDKEVIKSEVNKSKRALIIANGIYQKDTKWSNISSHNDIELIKKGLIDQGFPESNILIKKDLIYKALTDTFESFISKLEENDIVYVHFSGHGQQIYDDKETMDEKDGYDEAIIPVDAPGDYRRNGYKGERHLRDEKLGEYFNRIRKEIGSNGNLFASIDACHSGTGTRGITTKVRGASTPFEPENYKPVRTSSSENYNMLSTDKSLAPAVYFYGSSANQLNYEYKTENGDHVGSLSYALSKAFSEATKNTTYQGLFDQVKVIMATIAPNQSPQAEGTLNQKILGGEILGKKNYFLVIEHLNRDNNSFVRLNGGTLHGLNEGTKVAFYDIDGLNSGKPKNTGVVIKSDIIQSQIKLDKVIEKDDAKNSWVVITDRNYGDLSVSVSLDLQQEDLEIELNKLIDESKFISKNSTSPDLIIETPKNARGNQIQIYSKNDYVFWKSENPKSSQIIEEIKRYSRVNFIKGLEMENNDLNASFEFVPILMKYDGMDEVVDKEIPIDDKKNELGTIVFNDGDKTYGVIKNNSKKTLYYTLIDIQPDGVINVLIPESGRAAEEYYLDAGKEYRRQIGFSDPYGTEMFKLIMSEEPLDLRSILQSRGKRSKGKVISNPFELLFENSFNSTTGTRGGETINIPSGEVNIITTLFEIQE